MPPRLRHTRGFVAISTLALGAGLAAMSGCTTTVVQPPRVQESTRVVYREIPAPIVEPVPVLVPGMHWVPGHWVWEGRDWHWIPGHRAPYSVPAMPSVIVEQVPPAPSSAHFYVRGHWRWDGRAWVWVHGHWMR